MKYILFILTLAAMLMCPATAWAQNGSVSTPADTQTILHVDINPSSSGRSNQQGRYSPFLGALTSRNAVLGTDLNNVGVFDRNLTDTYVLGDIGRKMHGVSMSVIPFQTGLRVTPGNGLDLGIVTSSYSRFHTQIAGHAYEPMVLNKNRLQSVSLLDAMPNGRFTIGLNIRPISLRRGIDPFFYARGGKVRRLYSEYQHRQGYTTDLGIVTPVSREVTFGLMVRNILRPNLTKYHAPLMTTWGLAWQPRHSATVIVLNLADVGVRGTRVDYSGQTRLSHLYSLHCGVSRGRPWIGLGVGQYMTLDYRNKTYLMGLSLRF